MTFIKPLFLLLLSASILGFSSGCATLPDVAVKMEAAPSAQAPLQIASAKGLLSPKQTKANHGPAEAIG
jgi:predicted permease